MKKLKKTVSLLLVILLLISSLASCTGGNTDTTTDQTTPDTPEVTTPGAEQTTKESTTGEVTTSAPEVQIPKSLKILAIGNSFSTDAMQYLCQLLKAAGVEQVTLGNLYKGGCALAEHLSYGKSDSASYTYYKTTSGAWNNTKNYKMSAALEDEKWDYISFQQSSKTSGIISSYASLAALKEIVRAKAPDAKFIWHMTWAYQQDSTHASFPNYGKDQMKMYNMIVDCVKQKILTDKDFEIVIPCGTSIQNARTSFLGDHLTRDGYHLDYNIGRYIAGLTWCAALTGVDVDNVEFNPAPASVSDDMIKVAREAVKNSIAKPLEVTQSKITEGQGGSVTTVDPSVELNPEDFFEADKALASKSNIDLNKYTLLDWNHLNNTYWNCTSRPGVTTPSSSAGTYNQNVCSEKKYSTKDIPFGTVFVCDEGWQYRLDIFPNATDKYTGTRPGMITDRLFVLSETFMNGCTHMGWNIAANPKKDISAIFNQAAAHLRVYVPKDGTSSTEPALTPSTQLEADKTAAAAKNIDLTKYELYTWEYLSNTYWQSTSVADHKIPAAGSSTYNQFVCSKEKVSLDTLPLGTVFIVDAGWQIRLDIFPDATNKYTGTRTPMITAGVFVLTSDHMSTCKYMGWNVCTNPRTDISSKYAETASHLRIYVPKTGA